MVRQVLAAGVVEGREVQEAGMRRNIGKNVFPLVSFPGSTFCLIDGGESNTAEKNAAHRDKSH